VKTSLISVKIKVKNLIVLTMDKLHSRNEMEMGRKYKLLKILKFYQEFYKIKKLLTSHLILKSQDKALSR
jgi:hypothetical protein